MQNSLNCPYAYNILMRLQHWCHGKKLSRCYTNKTSQFMGTVDSPLETILLHCVRTQRFRLQTTSRFVAGNIVSDIILRIKAAFKAVFSRKTLRSQVLNTAFCQIGTFLFLLFPIFFTPTLMHFFLKLSFSLLLVVLVYHIGTLNKIKSLLIHYLRDILSTPSALPSLS